MDFEVPFISGYLNLPIQTGFSLNRISKKKSCQRYCLLFKASRHGIERLEICESKDDKNPKIITLENCVKITQDPPPVNVIQIVKKTGILTLNTLTDEDLKKWINALQTVAFRDKGGTQISNIAIEEDNDLYCRSYGDGLFIVSLIPSDTSKRCKIEQKAYMLHLTATELQLKSIEDFNVIVVNWPYRFIRKYGYRDGKFTFEAGRKCNTGEGIFTFDHTNPQEIFRCMSSKMKFMKKLISDDDLITMECVENQFNAVASMEAGSRSPLPPLPSNQSVCDLERNQNATSMRGFISSSDSLNNFSSKSAPNGFLSTQSYSLKTFSNKPPRKLPLYMENNTLASSIALHSGSHTSDKSATIQNYEPVSITTSVDPNKSVGSSLILNPPFSASVFQSFTPPQVPIRIDSVKKINERDYESIEAITDAWKTLGVNDVRHTERSVSNEESMITIFPMSPLEPQKNVIKDLSTTFTTKEIDIGEGDQGLSQDKKYLNYDRLDFLLPNNKASSEYKTIVTVTSSAKAIRMCFDPTEKSDYELISSPGIKAYRHDNDIDGYGIVRNISSSSLSPAINTNTVNLILPKNNIPVSVVSEQADLNGNSTNLCNQFPDHHTYNGLNYTIVNKPKKV